MVMKDRKRFLNAREAVFGDIKVAIFHINSMSLFLKFYTMNDNIQYQMFQLARIKLCSKLVMFDYVESYKEAMF